MAKDKLQSEFEDKHEFAKQGWSNYLDEALTDFEMYLGAQMSQADEQFAALTGRTNYVMNKMKRQVNLLSGYEIRNRHILKMTPISGEDDEVARQHTALMMQQMALFGGYDVMSQCFKWGPLVSGSNAMEIYRDRLGFFRYSRLSFNQFLLDPALRFTDLSDCGFYQTGRYLHGDTIKTVLPTGHDKIDKIPVGEGSNRWDFTHNHHYAQKHDIRLYEEYWRRKVKFVDTVISRNTGNEIPYKQLAESMEGGAPRLDFLIETGRLANGMPALSRYHKPVNEIKLSCFVDSELVWDGDNPTKLDDYNIIWFPGEWVPEMDRDELKLQAFVRVLRDPQKARNRRVNQTIDLVESQLTTYKVVKEGALKDFDDVWQVGQGKVIVVKSAFEGDLNQAFYQGPTPDIPPGFFQLLTVLDKEETDVGGMNEEIFGSDTTDIPAILARHRTGQSLTGHQGLFEGFRISKQQVGRKQARLNQIWQDPIRVQRMINEQPVPGFDNADMVYYDCLPTEGLLTDNQQELNFMEMKDMRQLFPDAADVITISDLIKTSKIQNKRELLQRIEAREQQKAQMLQQQQRDQEAMNKLVQAETAAKVARAEEDMSDIQVNKASTALKNAQAAVELLNLQNEKEMDMVERQAKVELMKAQAKAALMKPQQGGSSNAPKKRQKQKSRKR